MNYVSGENSGCLGGEEKERHLNKKHHYPRQLALIALNSNSGGTGSLPSPLTLPINVVSVSINTRQRELGEEELFFERTNILLLFTGTVNLPSVANPGITVTFNFQINRATRNGTTLVGPTFTFNETIVAATEALSFDFQHFDTGLEHDNYTYSIQIATGSAANAVGASITNARLTAIAVG